MLRRLLLILVFAVGLTGHGLVAEHPADASVPRHVATRSERVVRSVTAAIHRRPYPAGDECSDVLAGQRRCACHAGLLR